MRVHFAVLMWLINNPTGSGIDLECLPLDDDEADDVYLPQRGENVCMHTVNHAVL